jgi:hypothetical protein
MDQKNAWLLRFLGVGEGGVFTERLKSAPSGEHRKTRRLPSLNFGRVF